MANIDMTFGGAGDRMPVGRTGLYRLVKEIDIADVLVEKESALAALDVIQVFDIPKSVNVVNGQIHITTAFNSTTCTLDFGSGLDADQWIDGLDATSTGMGTPLGAAEYFAAADTLDVTLATMTGTLSTGKMTVIALVEDMTI